jgi:polyhydroxybutyrate depolymerase
MIKTFADYERVNSLRLAARQRLGIAALLLAGLVLLGGLLLYLNEIFGGFPGNFHLPLAPSSLPPITCKTPQHNAGDSTQTISSGDLDRTFLLHLSPSYGRQPLPLIISYHGYSWTDQMMVGATRFNQLADQEGFKGFIAAYPQGYESPSTWNAGNGASGPTGSEDDVQFTRDMLTYLKKNYCVDSQRIYVVGFSLGGGMAYRLACDLSDQITAVATASGAYYPLPEGCQPARPMPVLEIHGAADKDAPYAGYPQLGMASVEDYLNTWLTLDQCDTTSHVFLQQPDVTGSEWTRCASGAQIRHYRIDDGTHSWPSPPVLNGSAVIWDFCKQFSLPSPRT